MRNPADVTTAELKELLNKNWMTHDAMWFMHASMNCGMDVSNKLNCTAVREMGKVEVKRLAKTLEAGKITTYDELRDFVLAAKELVMPEFMKFELTFPGGNVFRGDFNDCFAYEGVKKAGIIEQYRCGIIERVLGWLDGLGVKFTITPEPGKCMLHTQGSCAYEIKVDL